MGEPPNIPAIRCVTYAMAIILLDRCRASARFWLEKGHAANGGKMKFTLTAEELAWRNTASQLKRVERDAQILACVGLPHTALL